MKESTTYQAILREGRIEGRVEGRAEGTVAEARVEPALAHWIQKRASLSKHHRRGEA